LIVFSVPQLARTAGDTQEGADDDDRAASILDDAPGFSTECRVRRGPYGR